MIRTGVAAAVRARLGHPAGLVAQTRRLFTLLALASLVLAVPALAAASGAGLWLAVAVFPALAAVWIRRYRTGRAPAALGVLEAVLVAVAAAVGPDPASIVMWVFASLWLRALYGSTRSIMVHTGLLAAAAVVGLVAWQVVLPGRGSVPLRDVLAMVNAVPVMFLTSGVARYLVRSLYAREASQQRQAALLNLGNRLIGVTDRTEIRRLALECATAVCAATPGTRLLYVVRSGPSAVVERHVGDLAAVPAQLPPSLLPAQGEEGARPLPADPALTAAAGPASTWTAVPCPEPGAWILLAGEPQVPAEAVVAIRSMTNQVAMALRTSEAHHDLATQASEDPLTGLLNRAAFTAALDAAIASADRRVALMFLDLDDFKDVNDALGHSAGDELLLAVAGRLRTGLRPGDVCARLGGDEFAVLLADRPDEDAVAVGQRLVETISVPVTLRRCLARVGASVGLVLAADPALTGEQLVQQADVAMYAAKARGKNRVQVFDDSLLQDDGRVQFEADLAAAAGAGRLEVHYQPVVSVRHGWCVAVEALVRWRHPERGLLHPAEFVPAAERTGAIVGIGAFVLRRACVDAAAWAGPAGPLAVHVNVSAAQLTDSDFVATVAACLTELAMEPRRLVLEITESMVLESQPVRAALDALAGLGVAIAIDDFGTGYSALSTLRTLPLDVVKIDKSFLVGGPSADADKAVVEAVVQMAARLGLEVVAEGVERVEQLEFLREVGAESAQGYLHLRPTPADGFERWLVRTGDGGSGAGPSDDGTVVAFDARRRG